MCAVSFRAVAQKPEWEHYLPAVSLFRNILAFLLQRRFRAGLPSSSISMLNTLIPANFLTERFHHFGLVIARQCFNS